MVKFSIFLNRHVSILSRRNINSSFVYFIKIVSLGDNLLVMLKPVFRKRIQEHISKSAEIFTQHAKHKHETEFILDILLGSFLKQTLK